MTERKVYKSKVDWWVYAVLAIMVVGCLVGPMIDGDNIAGIIVAASMAVMWTFCVTGMKYEINGNQLGIRNLYRWTWVPVEKICKVKKTRGGLATAAMSLDRVSISLSDRNVLKSSMPLIISPKDMDGFISELQRINPAIKYED